MDSEALQHEWEALNQHARSGRLSYRVLPVLTYQPPDATFDWLEVVLESELAWELLGADGLREGGEALTELAAALARRVPVPSTVSAWYYSSRAPRPDEPSHARCLLRSISIVFPSVPPYGRKEEPGVLSQVRDLLRQLAIPEAPELPDLSTTPHAQERDGQHASGKPLLV